MIFDHKGRTFTRHTRDFADFLGSHLPTSALFAYAVRNLGYVTLEIARYGAHVRLRPAIVSPAALEALLQWLTTHSVERVALSMFDTGWRHELMPASHAIGALLPLLESKHRRVA